MAGRQHVTPKLPEARPPAFEWAQLASGELRAAAVLVRLQRPIACGADGNCRCGRMTSTELCRHALERHVVAGHTDSVGGEPVCVRRGPP
jgi:hypothetical protein